MILSLGGQRNSPRRSAGGIAVEYRVMDTPVGGGPTAGIATRFICRCFFRPPQPVNKGEAQGAIAFCRGEAGAF